MNLFLSFVALVVENQNNKLQDVKPNIANTDYDVSQIVQAALLATIFLVILGIFFYLLDLWSKHWSFLTKLREPLKKNYFFILLLFPFFYLVFFYAYYLPNKGDKTFWVKSETVDYLSKASLTFLGVGVVTCGYKWLNNLSFFKKQFSELIKSEDFSNVLSEKMKDLAMSNDYLLQRNDLEEIWKRVTLCKYEQKFPELGPEIQKKLENDYFLEQSLMYYYKHFRVQINLSLEGDIIKITEISNLTVVSATTDKIEINFGTNTDFEIEDGIYAEITSDKCKCDGDILKLETTSNTDDQGNKDKFNKSFSAYLEGKKRYVIERQIVLTQDIKKDRVFSFSSSRLIEDLLINFQLDENLEIFFSPVGKNEFELDNHICNDKSKSYISRDLLLPGEKFKVFIYKKSLPIL